MVEKVGDGFTPLDSFGGGVLQLDQVFAARFGFGCALRLKHFRVAGAVDDCGQHLVDSGGLRHLVKIANHLDETAQCRFRARAEHPRLEHVTGGIIDR